MSFFASSHGNKLSVSILLTLTRKIDRLFSAQQTLGDDLRLPQVSRQIRLPILITVNLKMSYVSQNPPVVSCVLF